MGWNADSGGANWQSGEELKNIQKTSSSTCPPFHNFHSSRKITTSACRYTHAGDTVDLWRQLDKTFWLGGCLTDRNTTYCHIKSHESIHPSYSALSEARSWGQLSEQGHWDFPLPGHFLQLFWEHPKAFSGQPSDLVTLACPGSSFLPPETPLEGGVPGASDTEVPLNWEEKYLEAHTHIHSFKLLHKTHFWPHIHKKNSQSAHKTLIVLP